MGLEELWFERAGCGMFWGMIVDLFVCYDFGS